MRGPPPMCSARSTTTNRALGALSSVVLARRAERDLRRIGRGEALVRLREALESLAAGEANLDIKALVGAARGTGCASATTVSCTERLRPTKPVTERRASFFARVIHRRDLERAAAALE